MTEESTFVYSYQLNGVEYFTPSQALAVSRTDTGMYLKHQVEPEKTEP